ncbi:MAG: AraC family transcriptional regulator [Planctomycetota bacterium]
MHLDDWSQWCADIITGPLHFHLCDRTRCQSHWHIRQRRLDHHLLYVVQQGCIDAQLADERVLVPAGSALWVAPHTAHEFEALDTRQQIVLFHSRFSVPTRLAFPAWQLFADTQALEAQASDLLDAFRHAPPLREQRLRLQLAVLFNRLAERSGQARQQPGLDRQQRQLLESWLANHIRHDPLPSDLARELHLDPSWFARLFKRSYGLSPRSWLKRQRIRHAAALLEASDEAIGAIAERMGYSDIANFSKQFKAVMGSSPARYRQHLRML